jgi:radical SAM family uncharacterized protein/radical SAM-linked protein
MMEWEELEKILQKVEKPGRYLGGEWNAVRKNPDEVETKVALAFPDVYEIGMSYLGQKILYHVLNSQPHILAERVFAPWPDFERELREKEMPLFSLENKIPLDRFDIVGFSLLYELNYSNILTILDLGGIPIFAGRRDQNDPLVVAGGPAAFNPEPLAEYIDLFVIGDGEEAFLDVIRQVISAKKNGRDRSTALWELAEIKGVYVPALYEPYRPKNMPLLAVRAREGAPAIVKKRVLFPFQDPPFPEDIIVPHIQAIFDRVAWEVERGCPQKCRFCQASSIYFPPRVKNPSRVIEGILSSLQSTGYEAVSLASLSVSDYPYLEDVIRVLMGELEKRKVSLSLSSLRPKGLTPEVVENILKVRKTGFTLVPEAGTERLRAVINKCLTDREIGEAAENAFSHGWKRLKLYFMIGLPTEREEDLQGLVDMVKEIHGTGRKILKRPPQINLSLSPFIPKPHTPFQWLGMDGEDILKEKFRYVLTRLKKYPFIRLKRDSLHRSILEGIFSRGDRRLNAVLHQAWVNGARFDSWNDQFYYPVWEMSFESANLDLREYLSDLDTSGDLPWDHIDTGLSKRHFQEELALAKEGKPSASCMDRDCADCRGCSLSPCYQKEFIEEVARVETNVPDIGELADRVMRYIASFRKVKQARYLSQLDLNNSIQQGLRRAGIPVLYSQGFHPKMLISYPPALPLGMAGLAEHIEFKSRYVLTKEEFLSQVNSSMLTGIEFYDMRLEEETQPSMNKRIRAFVYSLDLDNDTVKNAIPALAGCAGAGEKNFSAIEQIIFDYVQNSDAGSAEKIVVDKKQGKLLITINNPPQKGRKPQEIVASIFGLQSPAFLMAREQIIMEGWDR